MLKPSTLFESTSLTYWKMCEKNFTNRPLKWSGAVGHTICLPSILYSSMCESTAIQLTSSRSLPSKWGVESLWDWSFQLQFKGCFPKPRPSFPDVSCNSSSTSPTRYGVGRRAFPLAASPLEPFFCHFKMTKWTGGRDLLCQREPRSRPGQADYTSLPSPLGLTGPLLGPHE